jgi:serine phosphatase RsbU (regulator of sigma subunit)/anti-sigma regulatory factor (Ser/Thr protein kinase)
VTTVPDEHRLAASLRFLSSASKALASSFDYARTIEGVARTLVPQYGDGFAVELNVEGAPSPVVSLGRFAGCSVADFPLVARDRQLGTLRIARDACAPGLDRFDEDLFAELAVRIAVAIDSAQIYAREHHVADTLQRALLPERLPRPGKQRFDAAYLPGAEEAIVGGDWYDAFDLPDGRLALSIGDVAGHGLRAAVVMGEVRQAFRAAALNPNSPSLVLERANTILNMRATPIMVTAIFGILDPDTSTITYATAGHPPPLIGLSGGSVQALPAGGLPLGIADQVEATDWTFTIPPGSLFALYTDGLIEYTRDIVEGEARLADAIRAEIVEPGTSPARSLLRRIFADNKNSDDVAALLVTVEDVQPREFRFDFSAIPLGVPLARRALQRYCDHLGLNEDRRYAVVAAIGEAMANAVEHAYGSDPGIVRLRVALTDGRLVATIEDDGRWKPAQRRDERGRGLPLMRGLMDGVEIQTHQSHTTLRLTLALNSAVGF